MKQNEQESNQITENNSSAITQTDSIGDVDKNKVLDRRKSGDESESSRNKKLDALAKGNQNDIKSMFEEHIAIKKGLIPDPNVNKGSVVKMRRKVNPNLPQPFKKFEEEEDATKKKRTRHSAPWGFKKIVKPFSKTFTGIMCMLKRFRIYFVWNPRLKDIESTS